MAASGLWVPKFTAITLRMLDWLMILLSASVVSIDDK
jgi:hypothetical protein